MYSVNQQQFESFLASVAFAKANGFDVTETSTGLRRWTPGKVNAKSQAMYRERLAAYKAQQSVRK